jgi:hypothetical protein
VWLVEPVPWRGMRAGNAANHVSHITEGKYEIISTLSPQLCPGRPV